MRITTKAVYEWDKDTKQYVEVYTEDYEYNGELALAINESYSSGGGPGGGGGGTSGSGDPWMTGGYGSPEWHPSYQSMMDWMDIGLDMGDVAQGFGLSSGDKDLLPPMDFWKSDYAERAYGLAEEEEAQSGFGEYDTGIPDDPNTPDVDESKGMGAAGLAQEAYLLTQEKTERQTTEAWEKYAMGMEGALTGADTTMYDMLEQTRARQSQAGFTGAGKRGQDRAMRQMEDAFSQQVTAAQSQARSTEAAATEAEEAAALGYQGAISDYMDAQRDLEAADITRDKAIETDKRDWYDDLWTAVDALEASGRLGGDYWWHGGEKYKKTDYDGSTSGMPATKGTTNNQKLFDLDSGKTWYYDTGGTFRAGHWRTSPAPNYTAGTCVLSTAAYQQGLITSDELMSFVKWRMSVQHKEFLGNVKWMGYMITWRPVSDLMLNYKWFAKLIRNTLLKGWMNVIKGKKGYLTRFIIEGLGLVGFLLNYRKATDLGKRLMANPKAILKEYRRLIKEKENG